ncbi:MAG: rod-binding protein [Roseovarius sp.]|nr:rod-binding protein [Roseovarius sp.]
MTEIASPAPAVPIPRDAGRPPDLPAAREAALRLEASFLSEMLKAAGLGEGEGTFSGGPGEAQFASFQRDAIAMRMARAGGLGLAEHFFTAMMEAPHAR